MWKINARILHIMNIFRYIFAGEKIIYSLSPLANCVVK